MTAAFSKRDVDRLDYDVDFADWLSPGDVLLSADALVDTEEDPPSLLVDSVELFGQIVKVWLSGGSNGEGYQINVTVTTALGRVKETSFCLFVRECCTC